MIAQPLSRPARVAPLAASLFACLGLAASSAFAVASHLSAGLPFSDVDTAYTAPAFSPNGLFAVYVEDAVIDGANELWSVASGGGSPVRLSDVLTPGQNVTDFTVTPDSSRVIYLANQATTEKVELWSVPIGGGVSTRLNPNLTTGGNVINFQISPTGDRVYFVADKTTNQKYELYGVPLTGGLAVRLDVGPNATFDVDTYAVSPDGANVVYRLVVTILGDAELYSVPATGPADDSVKLNPLLSLDGAVDATFHISPNSARVVYSADVTVDGRSDLWSVPITGGSSVLLTSGLAAGMTSDSSFLITPNSSRVVFRASLLLSPVFQLYSTPLAGGSVVRLNGTLAAGGNVATPYAVTPDSSRVVYRADEAVNDVDELWSVAVGGGTPVRLNGALVAGGDVLEHEISPNGARVVYRADQSVDTLNELWSVPTAGGAATKLNRTLVSGGDVQNFVIGSTSAWVIYGADQDADTADELLRAPIAGGTVENASDPLVGGGDVLLKLIQTPLFQISPLNGYDVLYVADLVTNDQFELFRSGTPVDDPTPPDACTPDATTLCLQGDKFKIKVDWRDFQGHTGHGQAGALSDQSGDFWFFNAASNELIVKVINGCASTGSYWVFWRALSNVEMDLEIRHTGTNQVLRYHNPLGYNSNGHLDIETIFHCDGTGPRTEIIDTQLDLPAPGPVGLDERTDPAQIAPCLPDSDRVICLQNGRFKVQGSWRDFNGATGYAHLIKKNESSGYGWFFSPNNYELLFKLVDACSFNGNTWVSIAGLTNVQASLTVTDTWTGKTYEQENGLAVDFPTNLDIETNLDYCGPHP